MGGNLEDLISLPPQTAPTLLVSYIACDVGLPRCVHSTFRDLKQKQRAVTCSSVLLQTPPNTSASNSAHPQPLHHTQCRHGHPSIGAHCPCYHQQHARSSLSHNTMPPPQRFPTQALAASNLHSVPSATALRTATMHQLSTPQRRQH
jgi:hypothetical protein